MFSSEDFGSNVFRVGNVDDVVLSPAHKSVASRYFASRSPVAAAPPSSAQLNWICACCEAENGAQVSTCGTCMVPRAPNAKTVAPSAPSAVSSGAAGGFTFGGTEASATTGFTFGDAPSSAAPVSGGDFGFQAAPAATSGFVFGDGGAGGGGGGNNGGFTFGGGAPATTGFSMGAAAAAAPASAGGSMWICQCCEAENAESATTCNTCMVPNPKAGKAVTSFALPDKPIVEEKKKPAPSSASWVCQCCEAENPESAATCNTCMVPNPKAAKAVTTFALPDKPIVAEKKRPAEAPLVPSVSAGRSQGSHKQAKPAPEAQVSFSAPETWKCAVCESTNSADATRCDVCAVARKNAPAESSSAKNQSPVVVVLSERHRAVADAYFAKRAAAAPFSGADAQQQMSWALSPRTPETETTGKSSPASSNASINDVTFNLTPIQQQAQSARGSVRRREADFVSPEVLRYEKKHITKEAALPNPTTALGGWRCSTCDWKNVPDATHCDLCLDKR